MLDIRAQFLSRVLELVAEVLFFFALLVGIYPCAIGTGEGQCKFSWARVLELGSGWTVFHHSSRYDYVVAAGK